MEDGDERMGIERRERAMILAQSAQQESLPSFFANACQEGLFRHGLADIRLSLRDCLAITSQVIQLHQFFDNRVAMAIDDPLWHARAEQDTDPPTMPFHAPEIPDSAQAVLSIEGMTCASCTMRVEKWRKKVPGVIDAQINLATEKATVTCNPVAIGVPQMIQKVKATGYRATALNQTTTPAIISTSKITPPSRALVPPVAQDEEQMQD